MTLGRCKNAMDAPAKLKVSWCVIPYIGIYTIMIIHRKFSQREADNREVLPVCFCMYVCHTAVGTCAQALYTRSCIDTCAIAGIKSVNGTRGLFG